MSLIARMRRQNAVYWPLTGVNEFGVNTFGNPAQILVRWEDSNEEFLDAEGTVQMSRSLVYIGLDVIVGGMLMLGVIADITDEVNIKENAGAWEIMKFDKLPNIKNTEFLRTAFL